MSSIESRDLLRLFAPTLPSGFRAEVFEKTWRFGAPPERVWAILSDPKTFTSGQIPPWRVEFLDLPDGRPGGFVEGCLNAHHGPGLSFHGVIGEVRAPEYRDLRYSYGSYAISMRLVRPTRLQFFLEDRPEGGTLVRVRLDWQVRRWFRGPWHLLNHLFWSSFGLSTRILMKTRRGLRPDLETATVDAGVREGRG